MILRELGYPMLTHFLQAIVRGELVIERATIADLARTIEILLVLSDSVVARFMADLHSPDWQNLRI